MSKTKHKAESGDSAGEAHTLKVSVPKAWEVVPLETVLESIVGGGTPSRDNPSYWNGPIPWLTVKDMRTRRPQDSIDHISDRAVRDSATNIIPADTVIMATRIGLGKVIRVPYDAAINQDLKALVTKPVVDKGYLEYWIYSIANYLESIGSGTTVKGIRLEHVRSLPFPLAPLDQQKRIVAEIEKQFSRLDEAIANLKRVKANLKRYEAAVLKAAVEGRLVETEAELARREGRSYETGKQLLQRILETRRSRWKGKGKYKEPTAPDTTDLPGLPEGWVWASVEQLGDVGTGATPLRSRHDYYKGGKIPWVTSGALNEEFVSAADEYITDLAVEETNAKVFPAHTLLVAMYGEGKTRGKVSELLIDAATNQACAAIVMEGLSERAREFTKLFFLKNYDDIRRLSSGGVQPNLNLSHIKATAIPLPSLAEQHRIVIEVDRRLSLVSKLESQVDSNSRRSDRLRQSILVEAFSGQLLRQMGEGKSAMSAWSLAEGR